LPPWFDHVRKFIPDRMCDTRCCRTQRRRASTLLDILLSDNVMRDLSFKLGYLALSSPTSRDVPSFDSFRVTGAPPAGSAHLSLTFSREPFPEFSFPRVFSAKAGWNNSVFGLFDFLLPHLFESQPSCTDGFPGLSLSSL